VVIPVRNERASLPATLNALAQQVDCSGKPLRPERFEVILLLNNCTDDSLEVARRWKAQHPDIQLHIVRRSIPARHAHVGTARRWLMDTAWRRMRGLRARAAAILTTDADTVVATDWIAQNLRAIARGAYAVGGKIEWKPGHFAKLPRGVQRSVLADREYQRL
jgi:glycosyltransferase involved in cell wall biosynthesis